jgi:hypothetical protein
MNRFKSLALAAAALLLSGTAAFAQISVIQQPGTVHASWTGFGQSFQNEQAVLYTVPADRYARLTDLIVTSRHSTGLCYFTLHGAGGNLVSYEIVVPPASTLHIPFNNGPGFAPGDQISVSRSNRIAGQCADYLLFTARGYLFTVP